MTSNCDNMPETAIITINSLPNDFCKSQQLAETDSRHFESPIGL